jgi:hypothetical protein
LIQWRSLPLDDEPRPELPVMPLSSSEDDDPRLDELCHEFEDELPLLGLLEEEDVEEEDDPISLDPLLRPEELPRPSDCPILLPNCELSLLSRETLRFTSPAEVELMLSLLILSRLRLSIQPPFRLVGHGSRRANA